MSSGETLLNEVPRGFKSFLSLRGHKREIARVVWSPDGTMLATPSFDNSVRIWNVTTGKHVRKLKGHGDVVFAAAWSPDGKVLATGSWDDSIRFWNIQTGKSVQLQGAGRGQIRSLSWSRRSWTLASASADNMVRFWDLESEECIGSIVDPTMCIVAAAWSPTDSMLAAASRDGVVKLWDSETHQLLKTLKAEGHELESIAWSPDERVLAAGTSDGAIITWALGETASEDRAERPERAAAGDSPEDQRNAGPIELAGHGGGVTCLSFSADGRLLASKSMDGTVRLWRCDIWECVSVLGDPVSRFCPPAVAFHPKEAILATLGDRSCIVRMWKIDTDVLAPLYLDDEHYANAKVIVLGDPCSGRGELVKKLADPVWDTGERFREKRIRMLETAKSKSETGRTTTYRDTLIWELEDTGRDRAVQQLQMADASVAIIVFDARTETNRFGGVRRWARLLQQVRLRAKNSASLKGLFLVGVRADDGRINFDQRALESLKRELGADACFICEVGDASGADELVEAVRTAIQWDEVPHASSTELFDRFVTFLFEEAKAGVTIRTAQNLIARFLERPEGEDAEKKNAEMQDAYTRTLAGAKEFSRQFVSFMLQDRSAPPAPRADSDGAPPIVGTFRKQAVQAEMKNACGLIYRRLSDILGKPPQPEADDSGPPKLLERLRELAESSPGPLYEVMGQCLKLAESLGLVRVFCYGELVLLRPDLLNVYATAVAAAARSEPNGLGCVPEMEARAGKIHLPPAKRIEDREQEKLMLVATVEELIDHKIATRVATEEGPQLVFPAAFAEEWDDAQEPARKAHVIRFEGSPLRAYSRLVVRLSHSRSLGLKQLWRNAATFHLQESAVGGVYLRELGEAGGELITFFDGMADKATRAAFRQEVQRCIKLSGRAVVKDVHKARYCAQCGTELTEDQVKRRLEKGLEFIKCCVCETEMRIGRRTGEGTCRERKHDVLEPEGVACTGAQGAQSDHSAPVRFRSAS